MYRIGHSTDIHRLEEGYKLILGGIEIPFEKGTVGHSDGDCLIHAICEAIIGAIGLGDMGTLFPDNDPLYKGIASSYFLNEIKKLLIANNLKIVNIDSTIFIEKPLISKYVLLMKEKIARILDIKENQINIKATRGEKLGFIGCSEGVVGEAVVLLETASKITKLDINNKI